MDAPAQPVSEFRAERLLGLAVNPHFISAVMLVAATGVAVARGHALALWLLLVAGAAGWSSAWTP